MLRIVKNVLLVHDTANTKHHFSQLFFFAQFISYFNTIISTVYLHFYLNLLIFKIWNNELIIIIFVLFFWMVVHK